MASGTSRCAAASTTPSRLWLRDRLLGNGRTLPADALTISGLPSAPRRQGRLLSNKPNSFRCDVAALPLMAGAGIDVAAMGNNRPSDYGFDALLVGRQNLTIARLHPVGAGENLQVTTRAEFFERGGRSPWCRSRCERTPVPRRYPLAPP